MNKSKIALWLNEPVVKIPCEYYGERFDHELYGETSVRKGTRRYDIDQLYKRLVDECITNNIMNDCGTSIINERNKPALQKMIYSLSKHKKTQIKDIK
jgi:hypothetical protein